MCWIRLSQVWWIFLNSMRGKNDAQMWINQRKNNIEVDKVKGFMVVLYIHSQDGAKGRQGFLKTSYLKEI